MVCARSIPFFYKNRRCVEGQMQIYLLSSITHTHKWQSIRYSKCINCIHNQRLMHILVIIIQTHTHKWQSIRYSKCINTMHYQRLMHALVIINNTHRQMEIHSLLKVCLFKIWPRLRVQQMVMKLDSARSDGIEPCSTKAKRAFPPYHCVNIWFHGLHNAVTTDSKLKHWLRGCISQSSLLETMHFHALAFL